MSPTASFNEIINSAPSGTFAYSLFQKISSLNKADSEAVLSSSRDFRQYVEKTLKSSTTILDGVVADLEEVRRAQAELISYERERRSQEEIKKKHEQFLDKWDRAKGSVSIMTGVMRFLDPEVATRFERSASALLDMSQSADQLFTEGFSAAASGNFIGAAFKLASSFDEPGPSEQDKYFNAKFDQLNRNLQLISNVLVGMDKKLDQALLMGAAVSGSARDQLTANAEEVRLLQRYVMEVDRARLFTKINTSSLICSDKLISKLFSIDNAGSLITYHDCLGTIHMFGLVDAAGPEAVSQTFARSLETRASVRVLEDAMRSGEDVEDNAALLESLDQYLAVRLSRPVPQPTLRSFSRPFASYSPKDAVTFSPRLWNLAIQSLIEYRREFPAYVLTTGSPSSRYIQDLGEIGEWLIVKTNRLSTDDVLETLLEQYRKDALQVGKVTQSAVTSYLTARYSNHLHKKFISPRADPYLDIPMSYILGFETDSDWRDDDGFDSADIRDLISLAGVFGLTKTVVTSVKTVGPDKLQPGAQYCFKATAEISLKDPPQTRLGTVSSTSCGVAGDSVLGTVVAGIRLHGEAVLNHYASYGYLSSHLLAPNLPEAERQPIVFSKKSKKHTFRQSTIEINQESYDASALITLGERTRATAQDIGRQALLSFFADQGASQLSNRTAVREYLRSLNQSFSALLIGLSTRFGGCGRENPSLEQIRRLATYEGDLDGWFDGKDFTIDRNFWRRLTLTAEDSFGRFQESAYLSRKQDLPAVTSILNYRSLSQADRISRGDLYSRALFDFENPRGGRYRYCYMTGVPSLIAGVSALSHWNGFIDSIGPAPQTQELPPASRVYTCRRGREIRLQNQECPAGYVEDKLRRDGGAAGRSSSR